jgi:hypothetical protein
MDFSHSQSVWEQGLSESVGSQPGVVGFESSRLADLYERVCWRVQGLGSNHLTLPTFMKGFIASTAAGLGVGLALGMNMEVMLSSIPPFFLAGGYERNPLPNLFPLIPASCHFTGLKSRPRLDQMGKKHCQSLPGDIERGEGSARNREFVCVLRQMREIACPYRVCWMCSQPCLLDGLLQEGCVVASTGCGSGLRVILSP